MRPNPFDPWAFWAAILGLYCLYFVLNTRPSTSNSHSVLSLEPLYCKISLFTINLNPHCWYDLSRNIVNVMWPIWYIYIYIYIIFYTWHRWEAVVLWWYIYVRMSINCINISSLNPPIYSSEYLCSLSSSLLTLTPLSWKYQLEKWKKTWRVN